jgi:acyl carrier protein
VNDAVKMGVTSGLAPEHAWLVNWFREQNADVANLPEEKIATANYFAESYIDSFGVIALIGDIEDRFGVRFDEDDFQNRRFATVDGLAGLIREKVDA